MEEEIAAVSQSVSNNINAANELGCLVSLCMFVCLHTRLQRGMGDESGA
jgi:hypothetical protein